MHSTIIIYLFWVNFLFKHFQKRYKRTHTHTPHTTKQTHPFGTFGNGKWSWEEEKQHRKWTCVSYRKMIIAALCHTPDSKTSCILRTTILLKTLVIWLAESADVRVYLRKCTREYIHICIYNFGATLDLFLQI